MYRDLPFKGILGKTKELDLIQFLIAEPNDYYNISSLADILGFHRDTISKKIKNLQKFKLVEFEEKGRSKCYRLNGRSKIVRAMDLLCFGIIDETGPDLNTFEKALEAFLPIENQDSISTKESIDNDEWQFDIKHNPEIDRLGREDAAKSGWILSQSGGEENGNSK